MVAAESGLGDGPARWGAGLSPDRALRGNIFPDLVSARVGVSQGITRHAGAPYPTPVLVRLTIGTLGGAIDLDAPAFRDAGALRDELHARTRVARTSREANQDEQTPHAGPVPRRSAHRRLHRPNPIRRIAVAGEGLASITAFHPRTAPACKTFRWQLRSGFATVTEYEDTALEYHALRHTVGMCERPAHRIDIRGPDAAGLLARACTADVEGLEVGHAVGGCLLDALGQCLDLVSVQRLDDDHFRLEASGSWHDALARFGARAEIEVLDGRVAVLAIVGPRHTDVLAPPPPGVIRPLDGGWIVGTVHGFERVVDVGDAIALWDDLGLEPIGAEALEIARIEDGVAAPGAEWDPAHLLPPGRRPNLRAVTPDAIGLGHLVTLDRHTRFVGQDAVEHERARGPARRLVGLELDLEAMDALRAEYGLEPARISPTTSWTPVYARDGRRQVGVVTSATWSPRFGRPIALAHLPSPLAETGTTLRAEHTVEGERRQVPASVVPLPFGR